MRKAAAFGRAYGTSLSFDLLRAAFLAKPLDSLRQKARTSAFKHMPALPSAAVRRQRAGFFLMQRSYLRTAYFCASASM